MISFEPLAFPSCIISPLLDFKVLSFLHNIEITANESMCYYAQIKIIYEDRDFLIIDKPSGLLTHPVNRQDKSESVVGWLLEKYPEIASVRDQYGTSVGEWIDPVRSLARAKGASPEDLGEATSNGADL